MTVRVVALLLLVLATGCTGDAEPGAASSGAASSGAPRATSEAEPGAVDAVERPDSTVSVAGGAPRSEVAAGDGVSGSSVEVVVAETLSRFEAVETPAGTRLTVPEQVLFDFGSATLRPDAQSALADLAVVVVFYDPAPVQVLGHTDAVGSDTANLALSTRRAEAVVRQLVDVGGVPAARLTPRGLGESTPVVPNTRPDGSDDPEGRARNRRVELVIDR